MDQAEVAKWVSFMQDNRRAKQNDARDPFQALETGVFHGGRWPAFCLDARMYAGKVLTGQASMLVTSAAEEHWVIEDMPDPDLLRLALSQAGADHHDVHGSETLRVSSVQTWCVRYFERQRGAKCGLHTLNNLLGGFVYNGGVLAEACRHRSSFWRLEQGYEALDSAHRIGNRWYSHGVFAEALQAIKATMWRITPTRVFAQAGECIVQDDAILGTRFNAAIYHWGCVTKANVCDVLF